MTNASLNIMHVLLSRGFAGSERSTAESCNEQVKQHRVSVVLRRDHRRRGASIVDHLDRRVQLIEVPRFLWSKRGLRKAIARVNPDVIHCHLRRSTRLVAKLNPAAATLSTLHIGFNGPHFWHMDGIVCNARWQLGDVPAEYPGLKFKANNSLVPHPRLDAGAVAALRSALGIAADDFLIGAVGRYHHSKGWDTLISAFKSLTQFPRAQLLFFGSGSLEKQLKQQAAGDQRIRFVGYRSDIKDLYQVFDLLVCPSRFEPLPRVMLEGMDAGVPVLASSAGGCKELIDDYGGFLFDVDNGAALAEQLAHCIATRPQRTAIDLSAHSIANSNAAMLNFYRQLIEKKRAP